MCAERQAMPRKTVIQTDQAREYRNTMDPLSQRKYVALLQLLEERGQLHAPFAEKVEGVDNLFALRIMTAGNYRYFYCYDAGELIFVLHGYSKKATRIPRRELARSLAIRKELGL